MSLWASSGGGGKSATSMPGGGGSGFSGAVSMSALPLRMATKPAVPLGGRKLSASLLRLPFMLMYLKRGRQFINNSEVASKRRGFP